MSKRFVVGLSLTLASVAVAQAQSVRTPVAPQVAVPAQASAVKPGDEALPCEALQKELVSTMQDPAILTYAAKTNAAYAKELEAQQQKKTPLAPQAAAAMAAALVPGAGMAGMPAMPQVTPGQPMTPQQMQQAIAAQQQASIAYMNQLAPIMPALMRSQRVTMLGMTKNCTWATGGLTLYPGAAVPGAIPPGTAVPRSR